MRRVPLVFLAAAGLAALFFALPLLGLLLQAPWSAALQLLTSPAALDALRLSLIASLSATTLGLLFGVPLAVVNARLDYPGRTLVRALVTLPMVLPPVVGGVALLLAFGRRGLIGAPLQACCGVHVPFTPAATVMSETFVAMPFLVISLEAALRGLDPRFEEAARSLGASRWLVLRRVTLPMVGPSLAAGAVLCWARALGEFGATITFAGNLPGVTQTLPLAVYLQLETSPQGAVMLSLLLLAVSLGVLVGLRGRWLESVR